jgi:hypothetical protein
VSGIAMVLLIYMVTSMFRLKEINMPCLNRLAELLFYAMIVDFSLELLDFVQRLYESEESIHILSDMISNRLFISLIISQIILGTIVPLVSIAVARFGRFPDEMKRIMFLFSALLVQLGIFSTRWNVVIGGQLFSKSLRGLTTYKLEVFGLDGLLTASVLLILPFIILIVLSRILPPWLEASHNIKAS